METDYYVRSWRKKLDSNRALDLLIQCRILNHFLPLLTLLVSSSPRFTTPCLPNAILNSLSPSTPLMLTSRPLAFSTIKPSRNRNALLTDVLQDAKPRFPFLLNNQQKGILVLHFCCQIFSRPGSQNYICSRWK